MENINGDFRSKMKIKLPQRKYSEKIILSYEKQKDLYDLRLQMEQFDGELEAYYPKPDATAKKSSNEKVTVRQARDEAAFLKNFYENDTEGNLNAENVEQANKLVEHSQTKYANAVIQSEQEKKDKATSKDVQVDVQMDDGEESSSDEEEVD